MVSCGVTTENHYCPQAFRGRTESYLLMNERMFIFIWNQGQHCRYTTCRNYTNISDTLFIYVDTAHDVSLSFTALYVWVDDASIACRKKTYILLNTYFLIICLSLNLMIQIILTILGFYFHSRVNTNYHR